MKYMTILAAAAAISAAGPAAAMATFAFDDGTNQGWQARVGNGAGTQFSLGAAGWLDINDFPSPLRADPIDGDGSAINAALSSSGITGDPIIFSFISPDLSGFSEWQDLTEVKGQVGVSFTGFDAYTADIRVVIEDTTGGGSDERIFAAAAAPLVFDDWTEIGLSGLDATIAGAGITSYTTQSVIFNIFQTGDVFGGPSDIERVFALDDVMAIQADAGGGPGGPGGGTSEIPLPAPALLLGAALLGLGAQARRRR